MPILIKNFTWTQTANTVNIRVPLNPVSHERVDLFTTESYIKANFSPFLLEIFLLYDIDITKSKCVVKDDVILLDLIKKEEIEWPALEKELTKPEKMQLKQQILEKYQENAQKEAEDRRLMKSKLDRFAVQRAMDIDSKQHAIMDSRRDEERRKAMNSLEEWRRDSEAKGSANAPVESQLQRAKIIELPSSEDESETEQKTQSIAKNLLTPSRIPLRSEYVEKKKEEMNRRILPKLRESAQLEITHTKRTFPTPSRESMAQEEETWLKNVTMARRATGFVSEDLRPEEQDPQWCKDKGDEFFRTGNFLGAISAYTHGITLSDKLPTLYANRAATHFALGNFNKCVNDCSTALDLMKPECERNRQSRAKCIVRRAAALARLGFLSKAINEMKVAAKLLPEDEYIKKDIIDMEKAWEQNPDSD